MLSQWEDSCDRAGRICLRGQEGAATSIRAVIAAPLAAGLAAAPVWAQVKDVNEHGEWHLGQEFDQVSDKYLGRAWCDDLIHSSARITYTAHRGRGPEAGAVSLASPGVVATRLRHPVKGSGDSLVWLKCRGGVA
jgi:hypothetical protein